MFVTHARAADPLPSWNDTAPKQAIIAFVEKVTKEGSPDFVPSPNASPPSTTTARSGASSRCISKLFFAFDRIKALAPQHPEWKDQEPFASAAQGRHESRARRRRTGLASRCVMATHAGMTTEEFEKSVTDWIATAKHPKTGKPLHRDGLSADARTARLPPRERLQDLHRLRRRHRVHAPLDGEGLRHPARAGRRQQRRSEV